MAQPRVWLWADTLTYPLGGGHLWVYLNWALGLKSIGCEVTWLEAADPDAPAREINRLAVDLRGRLSSYGIDRVALCSTNEQALVRDAASGAFLTPQDNARDADLLLNFCYAAHESVVKQFRRTALVDIDPGLLQVWLSEKQVRIAPYDVHFTIGETVGQPGAKFPAGGLDWQYTPPCVALEHWPVAPVAPTAPFTTVSHWSTSKEWVTTSTDSYHNDKRSGFEPYFDLPRLTRQPLLLALCQAADETLRLAPDEEAEKRMLQKRGWQIVHAYSATSMPWDYQNFIRQSRGEFSCCKPSCVRLQNAWISDRTICYLAAGRPAIVEHTGPSRFLPDAAGIFRFRDLGEAARYLDHVAGDYDRQCKLARALAEEFFDAGKVAKRVLERAMG